MARSASLLLDLNRNPNLTPNRNPNITLTSLLTLTLTLAGEQELVWQVQLDRAARVQGHAGQVRAPVCRLPAARLAGVHVLFDGWDT